jgi:hypothetical protein
MNVKFGHWKDSVCRLLPRNGSSSDSGRRKQPPDTDRYECVQQLRGMATRSCPPALGLYVRVKSLEIWQELWNEEYEIRTIPDC